MPVNRLKLMAFAFGAAVAALTGTFATALNGSVFPQNFEFPLLITVYTMVILGGAGSQAGVVLGAVIVSVLLEALRDASDARGLFYVVIVLGLFAVFRASLEARHRPRGHDRLRDRRQARRGRDRRRLDRRARRGERAARPVGRRLGDRPGRTSAEWVPARELHRADRARPRADARAGVGADRAPRADALPGAFVWENVLLTQPESTRYIVIGALLVAMMVARPQGLLGEKRVEIV